MFGSMIATFVPFTTPSFASAAANWLLMRSNSPYRSFACTAIPSGKYFNTMRTAVLFGYFAAASLSSCCTGTLGMSTTCGTPFS